MRAKIRPITVTDRMFDTWFPYEYFSRLAESAMLIE